RAVLRVGARAPGRDHGHRVRDRADLPAARRRGLRGHRGLPVRRRHELDGAVDQGDQEEMTTAILAAEEGIQPGKHWTVQIAGLSFNLDTIIATLLAAAIVTGAGLY